MSCSYRSNAGNPDRAELQPRGNRAYAIDGKIFVRRSVLSELDFSGGLAAIHAERFGWLFVKRDGSTVPTVTFDNGPDVFSEGLARYLDRGKMGFIDRSGKVMIKAQYGFASPFQSGHSAVCNDPVVRMTGEHQLIRSGHWGCIDRSGRLVLPMKFSDEEIRAKLRRMGRERSGAADPAHASSPM